MPVAVMAAGSSALAHRKLLEQCETQELEAPGGIATPPVYAQLLALYLLHNDMNNARYLWKRIPAAIKSANPELGAIWSVGQRIWQRDFPGIYTTIGAHQWSETIQPIMEALRDATRRRAFGLVSQAYTSISADDFAAFVGLPVEEAVKGVLEQGWQADSSTRMVMPKKPGPQEPAFNRFHPLSEPALVPPIPNEQQLARLTDYVAFLEN
uniref:COP9 signalosome complex subunit 8 n=1 Tax=Euleptes europaea TaxID=460621 RepID=UPI00253FB26C|nr:COP9 signalosome complex subunit 8 [Euleptes europaea]